MKTVYELSESEIEEAIREWLERKNPTVEVITSHVAWRSISGREEVFASVWFVEHEQPRLSVRSDAVVEISPCVDFVTGEKIPVGTQVLWFEGYGVTRTPPELWPESLSTQTQGAPKETKLSPKVVKGRSRKSSPNIAADILGGSGGVLSHSSALGEGLDDEV